MFVPCGPIEPAGALRKRLSVKRCEQFHLTVAVHVCSACVQCCLCHLCNVESSGFVQQSYFSSTVFLSEMQEGALSTQLNIFLLTVKSHFDFFVPCLFFSCIFLKFSQQPLLLLLKPELCVIWNSRVSHQYLLIALRHHLSLIWVTTTERFCCLWHIEQALFCWFVLY